MSFEALIRHLLNNPDEATYTADVRRPGFFNAFIRHVKTVTNSDPARSLPMLNIGLRIVTSECQSVQVWGLRAAAQRALGAPARALAVLEVAFLLAGSCRPCRADLLRRRAKIHAALGGHASAISDADNSVKLYRSLHGQPDHDIDGNGLAASLVDRGDIRHYFGVQLADSELLSGSVEDIANALDIIVPSVSPVLYRTAVFDLSVALYSTGKRSDLELAEHHLRTARNLFRGPTKPSQERAKVAWATGMVRHELGGYQRCRIEGMLEFAHSDFITLGLIAEACAVASDLSKVAFPDRNRIHGIMAEMAQRVAQWIEGDIEGRRQFVPLGEKATQVVTAAARKDKGWRGFDELRQSIEHLRDVCGPRMLPCLISWPAK